MKTSDFRCIPLCYICHAEYNRVGRLTFWGDTDVEVVISILNVQFYTRSL